MYNNFNGSPLHHSLYRPMLDANGSSNSGCSTSADGHQQQLQQQQQQQQRGHQTEDNILEGEAIPAAGISRQQLINR